MEKTGKKFYTSPATEVIEVEYEGIICQSVDTEGSPMFNGFNKEQEW